MRDEPIDQLEARLAGATFSGAQRIAVVAMSRRASIDAAVDARRLLMLATGCDAIALVTTPERRLTPGEAGRYASMIARRLGGEPVSRIAGRRGFYGREFVVSPATLDPRPESETLIDAALNAVANEFPRGSGLTVLDIGTGTGCLLLTLLAELPEAAGVGVDISPAALAVAAENAQRLGVAGRVRWVEGRGFSGLGGPFRLIVSNPPYIATGEIGLLDDEVKDFDPLLALDGGLDGLDIYREIADDLARRTAATRIVFEVGDGQAGDVIAIVRAICSPDRIREVVVHRDMAGKQRCVAMWLQN